MIIPSLHLGRYLDYSIRPTVCVTLATPISLTFSQLGLAFRFLLLLTVCVCSFQRATSQFYVWQLYSSPRRNSTTALVTRSRARSERRKGRGRASMLATSRPDTTRDPSCAETTPNETENLYGAKKRNGQNGRAKSIYLPDLRQKF